jgi:hypothetical protein
VFPSGRESKFLVTLELRSNVDLAMSLSRLEQSYSQDCVERDDDGEIERDILHAAGALTHFCAMKKCTSFKLSG